MSAAESTAASTHVDRAVPVEADVVVVGSGAGGATTAALLAEAGFSVVILEEGPWIPQGALRPFSLEQMTEQYRGGGVTVALGRPSIAYAEGRCAGGGTEINSGLYIRPPHDLLERWRQDFRISDLDEDEITEICSEVETALSVGFVPGRATLASERLRDGAIGLGWQQNETPRWMTYPPGGDAASGKRQSMTETYLPRAIRAGAQLVTGCVVDRLEMRFGRVDAVEYRLEGGAVPRAGRIRCGSVFVCAGAIHSPALLQRSGISGPIGRTLAFHPTVKLAARFTDIVNDSDDVPVHQVKEFSPNISFGGSATNSGLVALALSDHWRIFSEAVTDWERIAIYYAAITSQGTGRVRSIPGFHDPLVTYRLTGRDREVLRSGLGRLTLTMLQAGATEVYPSFRGAPVVRNLADLGAMERSFSAMKASLMTVHLCSTVPLGEDRDRCAANSFGRIHSTANVYVNDASMLPTAPGVNPQGSVMAFAVRNARHFIATAARRAARKPA